MADLQPLKRHAMAIPARLPPRRPRRMGTAALVSLGLHASVLGLAVAWALYHPPVVLEPANEPATVQLVMSPPGGQPAPAAAPQPEKPPAPDTPKATEAAPKAPPEATATAEAAPPPVAAPPPPAPPAPAAPTSTLNYDFANVESDTNALVTGDLVVPASPDVKYHNRKPSYPDAAAFRGEQGAVVLLIHVSPDGLVSSVDVLRSSGHPALDSAARDAVLTWHFLPSVRDGEPVPAEVPMRFIFALD
jgi:protein TonB